MFPGHILQSNTYPDIYFYKQMCVNIRICLFADNWRKKRQMENDGKLEEHQYSECCKNPERTHFSLNGNGIKICTIKPLSLLFHSGLMLWGMNSSDPSRAHALSCTSLAPGSLSILILFPPPPPGMKGTKKFSNQIHSLQVEVARMGPYFSRKRFPLWTCVSLSVQPLKDLVAQ